MVRVVELAVGLLLALCGSYTAINGRYRSSVRLLGWVAFGAGVAAVAFGIRG